MGFTDWLTGQKKSGLVPDEVDNRDMQKQLSEYYHQYVDDYKYTTGGQYTTTTGTDGTLTEKQLKDAYKTMTTSGTYVTNSTVSSGFTGSWDQWTKEEKKALAKVGFRYDQEKNEWVLDLTATIRIPQLEGFAALSGGGTDGKPTDQMITNLKQVKEQLIEKLTAKIILAELVRPREIKDDK